MKVETRREKAEERAAVDKHRGQRTEGLKEDELVLLTHLRGHSKSKKQFTGRNISCPFMIDTVCSDTIYALVDPKKRKRRKAVHLDQLIPIGLRHQDLYRTLGDGSVYDAYFDRVRVGDSDEWVTPTEEHRRRNEEIKGKR